MEVYKGSTNNGLYLILENLGSDLTNWLRRRSLFALDQQAAEAPTPALRRLLDQRTGSMYWLLGGEPNGYYGSAPSLETLDTTTAGGSSAKSAAETRSVGPPSIAAASIAAASATAASTAAASTAAASATAAVEDRSLLLGVTKNIQFHFVLGREHDVDFYDVSQGGFKLIRNLPTKPETFKHQLLFTGTSWIMANYYLDKSRNSFIDLIQLKLPLPLSAAEAIAPAEGTAEESDEDVEEDQPQNAFTTNLLDSFRNCHGTMRLVFRLKDADHLALYTAGTKFIRHFHNYDKSPPPSSLSHYFAFPLPTTFLPLVKMSNLKLVGQTPEEIPFATLSSRFARAVKEVAQRVVHSIREETDISTQQLKSKC